MSPEERAALAAAARVAAVRAALEDLCALAGAQPDDGSAGAGRAVLAVARSAGKGERADPQGCAVYLWLRQQTGITGEYPTARPSEALLLVTAGTLLVVGPKPADGARPRTAVALPPAVRAAVRVTDALTTQEENAAPRKPPRPKVLRMVAKKVRAAVGVEIRCPECKGTRTVRIFAYPSMIAKASGRMCVACAKNAVKAA